MRKYVGVKMVQAEPMGYIRYCDECGVLPQKPKTEWIEPGYKVVYPDGYVSWSTKEVFEKAYMKVGDNNTIEEHNVNDFIVGYDVQPWGDKTTVVHATLANGFIVSESSSCVDAANFNMDIGYGICKEHIQNAVWKMLGFLLQCGVSGIKKGGDVK